MIRDYTFDHLIAALEELEDILHDDPNLPDIDYYNEYDDMLNTFQHNIHFQNQRFPSSFNELVVSRDIDKLIDFIGFLGIDVGYGGDSTISNIFYNILKFMTKDSTGF